MTLLRAFPSQPMRKKKLSLRQYRIKHGRYPKTTQHGIIRGSLKCGFVGKIFHGRCAAPRPFSAAASAFPFSAYRGLSGTTGFAAYSPHHSQFDCYSITLQQHCQYTRLRIVCQEAKLVISEPSDRRDLTVLADSADLTNLRKRNIIIRTEKSERKTANQSRENQKEKSNAGTETEKGEKKHGRSSGGAD